MAKLGNRTLRLRPPGCTAKPPSAIIDGKWQCVIHSTLLAGTVRFTNQREFLLVTHRPLTNQTPRTRNRGLMAKGHPQVPAEGGIRLSELGRSMTPV